MAAHDLPDFDLPEVPKPKAGKGPVAPALDDDFPVPASTKRPPLDPAIAKLNLVINNPADFLDPGPADTLYPPKKETVEPAPAPVDVLYDSDEDIRFRSTLDPVQPIASGTPDFVVPPPDNKQKVQRLVLLAVPVAVVVALSYFGYQHRFEIGNTFAGLFGSVKSPAAVAAPDTSIRPQTASIPAPVPKPAPVVEAAPVIQAPPVPEVMQPAPAPVPAPTVKAPEPAAPAIDRPFVSPAPLPMAIEPAPAPAPKVVAKAPAVKKPAPQRAAPAMDAETERLEAISRALDAKINQR